MPDRVPFHVTGGCSSAMASLALFLSAAVLGGCEAAFHNQGIVVNPRAVNAIKAKAVKLAESELAKFNAIEQTYKDTSELHICHGHPFNPGLGVYIKMYRTFTAYEILDIRRTDSLLYPLVYDIRFDYEMWTTPPRINEYPESEELSKKDTEFTLRAKASVTRQYRCKADGEYDGALPTLPERDNYYRPGNLTPIPVIGAPTAGVGAVGLPAAPSFEIPGIAGR